MREARRNPAVLFQNYLRSRKQNKYVCFFEGDTDRYYYFNILDELLKTNFLMFPCQGKDNLIKILELAENEKKETANNIHLMFFMDGDYSNKIKYQTTKEKYDSDFFILNAYSFENYYCSYDCVQKILIREFGIEQDSDVLLYFLDCFQMLEKEAKNSFTILNKSYYIIRELRKIDHKKVVFNKVDAIQYDETSNVIKIEDVSFESIVNAYDIEEFTLEEKDEAEEFFKDKNLNVFGRGHNQIKLLTYFFRQLYKNIKVGQLELNGQKLHFRCNVDFGREIIEHCAYAADKPKDLIGFIESHIPN